VDTSHTELTLTLRERVRRFIEGSWFEASITALILANAITLGLETSPSIAARIGDVLDRFDQLVLVVFVVELLLRLFVHRGRFFRDPWRVFDLVVVGIAVVPAGGAFAVLRAMRVLRVLRLVSLVPSMRRVISALLKALPGMASIVGLLGLVLYVFSVLATELFGATAVPGHDRRRLARRGTERHEGGAAVLDLLRGLPAHRDVHGPEPVHCGGRQRHAVAGHGRPQGRGRSTHPGDPRRGACAEAGDRVAAWVALTSRCSALSILM
jgi:hypothetical protein